MRRHTALFVREVLAFHPLPGFRQVRTLICNQGKLLTVLEVGKVLVFPCGVPEETRSRQVENIGLKRMIRLGTVVFGQFVLR